MCIYFDDQRRLFAFGRPQRSQRRGQHDARVETGLFECRLVVVNDCAQGNRRYNFDLVANFLRVIGDLRLVYVKRQRLLEAKPHHPERLFLIGGKGFEIHEHDADRGVGNDCDHIPGAPGNSAQRGLDAFAHRGALPEIRFHEVGNHAARRQFPRGGGFEAAAVLHHSAGKYTIGRDLTGQFRFCCICCWTHSRVRL